MKLIRSFLITCGFSFITRGIGFLARIALTRSLLPYELGLYTSSLSLFHVFVCLCSSGLPLAVSRLYAVGKRENTLLTSFIIGLCLSLFGVALPLLFKPYFLGFFQDGLSLTVFYSLLPVLPLTALYSVSRGALLGKERFFEYSLTEAFDELIYFISLLALFLAFKGESYAIFAPVLAMIISTALSSAVSLYFVLKRERLGRLSSERASEILKIALPITSTRVLSSILSAFTTLILPTLYMLYGLTKTDALSLIGALSGVISPLIYLTLGVIGPLCLVLLPDMAKKGASSKSRLLYSFLFTSILTALVLSIYLTHADELLFALYLKAEGGEILRLCSISMLPLALNQLCASTLNACGEERYSLISFIIASVSGIAVILLLTPKIGVYAHAISIIIQPIIALILNGIRVSGALNITFKEFITPITTFLIAIPLCVIAYAVKRLPLEMPELMSLMLSGGVALIATALFSYLFIPSKKGYFK